MYKKQLLWFPVFFLLILLTGCGENELQKNYELAKKLSNKGPLTDTGFVRRLETSEELLEQIARVKIKASKQHVYVLEKMLDNYENLKMWNKAAGVAEKLTSLQPGKLKWYIRLGRIHSHLSVRDESHIVQAERAFRTALELEPNSIRAHYGLGVLYGFRTDKIELAREHLKQASFDNKVTVKKRPYIMESRFAFGKFEYSQGNPARAVEPFKSILEMESIPTEARFLAHKNLGDVYKSMNSSELASQHYQKAYDIQPTNSEIRSRLRSLGVSVEDRYNRFE